jgi:transcriptional regulator with XRE-family HTH domain
VEVVNAVAENIRRIRKTQKLSIDRAAELTGVSKSMFGQIERGLVNPTVAGLEKIAQGLHVSLAELVEHRGDLPDTYTRGVDVAGQRLEKGRVIRHPLFPFDTESRCESCQLDIFIGGSYDLPDRIPGSRVYVTVLSGMLEVRTGTKTYRLESRDCLSFKGSEPCRYANAGNTTVHLIQRIYYGK